MTRRVLAFVCSWAAACSPPVEYCPSDDMRSIEIPALPFADAGVRLEALRAAYPAVADAELISLDLPPSDDTIDVAFISEGFTAADLAAFTRETEQLAAGVRQDEVLRDRRTLFRFHRFELASTTSATTNATLDDTVLGVCLVKDPTDGTTFLKPVSRSVGELVRARFPSVDVTVVLVNAASGRSNAQFAFVSDRTMAPTVTLRSGDGASVLLHELGHALFSLADEYVDSPDAVPRSALLLGPDDGLFRHANVSLDSSGAKWAGLVTGAREGGLRFRRGVWHPTDHCRMLSGGSGAPFCPVCRNEIDRVLAVFAGTASAPAPECGVTINPTGTLTVAAVSLSPVQLWARAGCATPCPSARPPNVVRAGVGWIVRDPPPGSTERERDCLAACRYPGDPQDVVGVTTLLGTPGDELEVNCANSSGSTRRFVSPPQ